MDFTIETAKSGRAKCGGCAQPIPQGSTKLVEHSIHAWTKRPTSQSFCTECSIKHVETVKEELEKTLAKLRGESTAMPRVSI